VDPDRLRVEQACWRCCWAALRADKRARKAPDALKRDFTPPEQQGNLTAAPPIPTATSLYTAAVPSAPSSHTHHDAELARAALCVAIAMRGGDVAGVIFHTDQGSEYTAELFAHACASVRVTQSMGRTGSALDNAVSESNSTVEFELLRLRLHRFATHQQARRGVSAFIDRYNRIRRHSTCQMLSPIDYERAQERAATDITDAEAA
jgi:putative transposase